jgi:hypothetical protein
MTHQGWDVQTDRLRGARLAADVLPVGIAHSVVAGSHGRSGGRQIEDAFCMLVDRCESMVQDGRREFYGSTASPARGRIDCDGLAAAYSAQAAARQPRT